MTMFTYCDWSILLIASNGCNTSQACFSVDNGIKTYALFIHNNVSELHK